MVSFRVYASFPTLPIQLDSEEVLETVNPARQAFHSSNKTTDYMRKRTELSQAMAR
jgi:hypothetical protein